MGHRRQEILQLPVSSRRLDTGIIHLRTYKRLKLISIGLRWMLCGLQEKALSQAYAPLTCTSFLQLTVTRLVRGSRCLHRTVLQHIADRVCSLNPRPRPPSRIEACWVQSICAANAKCPQEGAANNYRTLPNPGNPIIVHCFGSVSHLQARAMASDGCRTIAVTLGRSCLSTCRGWRNPMPAVLIGFPQDSGSMSEFGMARREGGWLVAETTPFPCGTATEI